MHDDDDDDDDDDEVSADELRLRAQQVSQQSEHSQSVDDAHPTPPLSPAPNTPSNAHTGWTAEELAMNRERLDAELRAQEATLRADVRRRAAAADQVTPEMVEDCKQLLQLFGVPYVEAPYEAEAQCAALQMAGLADGVVSDDSDVLLFGATTVFRHMFRSEKYLERYDATLIDTVCGLQRDDLIELALLLGSDYTEGVHGIGHVRATELIA